MKVFLLAAVLLPMSAAMAKPALDLDAIHSWPGISEEKISGDGRYVAYVTYVGDEVSATWQLAKLTLRSTHGDWRREIVGFIGDVDLTSDGRRAIILHSNTHRLEIMELGGDRSQQIEDVDSYQLPREGDGQWVAYRRSVAGSGESSVLVLRNLRSGSDRSYAETTQFQFSQDGRVLLFQTRGESPPVTRLHWVDLPAGTQRTVWEGQRSPGQIVMAPGCDAVAFVTTAGGGNEKRSTLWRYRKGASTAEAVVEGRGWPAPEAGYFLTGDAPIFSVSGKRLYIKIIKKPPTDAPVEVSLDVWSYKDQDPKNDKMRDQKPVFAVVDLAMRTITRVSQEDDWWSGPVFSRGGDGEYAAVMSPQTSNEELYLLHRLPPPSLYLINVGNGTRRPVVRGRRIDFHSLNFSPSGRYLVWYDVADKAVMSYDIHKDVTVNLTQGISPAISPETLGGDVERQVYQPALWIRDDGGLILYDEYDLWLVDLTGKRAPRNLTHGYGKAHQTHLRYVDTIAADRDHFFSNSQLPIVGADASLLLCAFDDVTKKNGFFRQTIAKARNPIPLILSAEVIFSPPRSYVDLSEFMIKARQADAFLVKRMSATEYGNLYVTEDFKSYRKLTDLHPQTNYNWYTSELVHWTTFDGRPGEGVLYKPEDFDPGKKYPLIVHYYMQMSPGLNMYWPVGPSAHLGLNDLNIPWYVSHGYLVFTPDIHYVVGKTADSVYNFVASGAKWISRLPWVDTTRMGLQGHSFGGYETNILITRTDTFAAAVESAGASDMLALYSDDPVFVELGQYNMGSTPWDRPSDYMANSAVFGAGRITVPLLILQNPKDGGVPWSQGVEMFTALRRQNKRVWMLSYDDQGHNLPEGPIGEDFLKRNTQFFDYYLKGAPPPRWMTEGVPARLKGIETGLELDTSGAVP